MNTRNLTKINNLIPPTNYHDQTMIISRGDPLVTKSRLTKKLLRNYSKTKKEISKDITKNNTHI
jgi:hypothetical protein